jgi:uncharacterized membrane protein YoaK (UPF0700 family)
MYKTMQPAAAPPIKRSLATEFLPTVLSLTAGSVDVISFLGLGGLFTAHITGNLVILAAHIVSGEDAPFAVMLSVPVFMAVLLLTRLLAAGSSLDPNAANAIVAGMLGVAAMAVQNAIPQISLTGAPSTAVMTTNVTRFMMDLGEMLVGHDPKEVASARRRAKHTWPPIVGFTVGCGLGAACEAAVGLWSLALPAGLALFAVVMGFAAKLDGEH